MDERCGAENGGWIGEQAGQQGGGERLRGERSGCAGEGRIDRIA